MDFTFELAKMFSTLPFEILKQDKDEVIMIINYMIEKGDGSPSKSINKQNKQKDAFWDF